MFHAQICNCPIHIAAINGNLYIVEIFFNMGFPHAAPYGMGQTVFELAQQNVHQHIVDYLINAYPEHYQAQTEHTNDLADEPFTLVTPMNLQRQPDQFEFPRLAPRDFDPDIASAVRHFVNFGANPFL